jgi:hypothetical protein
VPGGRVTFSAQLREALAHLRAAGAREEVVGAAGAAEFDRQTQILRQESYARYLRGEISAATLAKERRELGASRERALRALLGESGYRAWDRENQLLSLPAGDLALEPAERDAVYRMHQGRAAAQAEIGMAFERGEIDPQEREIRTKRAEAEYDRGLRESLGAERYEKVRQDTDRGFQRLRGELSDFRLGEAELAKLFRARSRWQEEGNALYRRYNAGEISWPTYTEELKRKRKTYAEESERAVGSEAYAEIRRLEDPRYHQMKQHAAAFRLSREDIEHVYSALQGDVERAEEELRRFLGEERFAKLKRAHVLRSR